MAAIPEDRLHATPPMADAWRSRHPWRALHPLHAILLASTLPLWTGAVLADWAYHATQEIQWSNFASWLIAGALVFSGFAWLWSLVDWLRDGAARRGAGLLLMLLLLAVCLLGFVDALVHAKDAWAVMPEGLVLSVLVMLLALGANVVGFFSQPVGARP